MQAFCVQGCVLIYDSAELIHSSGVFESHLWHSECSSHPPPVLASPGAPGVHKRGGSLRPDARGLRQGVGVVDGRRQLASAVVGRGSKQASKVSQSLKPCALLCVIEEMISVPIYPANVCKYM